ncbi:MAG: nucleotide exchange factor GrpE [Chlamydiales bacterium]|nr:nucleotide exchange factor GrpE [Chlamydiales bacterium]
MSDCGCEINENCCEQVEAETLTSMSDLQLEQLRKSLEEANEYKNKYLLTLAELENTRKRLQKEKQEMMKFAVENILCDFLTPLDSMENAMKFTDQMSVETKNWVFGFNMLVEQLKTVLAEHGVTSYSSIGETFDPYFHEAVEMVDIMEGEDGLIVGEFVKGYKCGDRVLRPAKVKVTKKQEKNKE